MPSNSPQSTPKSANSQNSTPKTPQPSRNPQLMSSPLTSTITEENPQQSTPKTPQPSRNPQPMSSPLTSTITEEKPWSERELILQELEREEEISRREMAQRAVPVISLAKVEFPIAESAIESIMNLQNGEHNWIQLTLNNPPTQIEVVECKTVTDSELVTTVDQRKPQFYLYNRQNEAIVVIYCCPEQVKGEQSFAQGRQNRMIYATAKSSLIEGLTNLNLTIPLKKYDVTDPQELEESALNVHLLTKAADIKNAKLLTGASSFNAQTPNRGPGYRGNPGMGGVASLASVMVANPGLRKPLPKV
jgi:hypothetical protein